MNSIVIHTDYTTIHLLCVPLVGCAERETESLYQERVTAPDDAEAQARASLGDLYGGLAAGDDGTGHGVRHQRGRSGRPARTWRTRRHHHYHHHHDNQAVVTHTRNPQQSKQFVVVVSKVYCF